MSLIFDAAGNEPQTHILLIFVGGYPFLKGGATPIPQTLEIAQGLGQLTSPGASLAALYDKIMDYHTKGEWSKPLGSVEILFTPPPNTPAVLPGLNIENASILNIQTAYANWKNRCDQHADNVALFIFCGHGAEKEHQYLLADDFGSLLNPWLGAFNFELTKMAFKSCKAQTQIFFVDACRQITSDMITSVLAVAPLETPSQLNSGAVYNFTVKAAASNQAAHGMENEPSYFTKAMLIGLDGFVARKDQNKWLIETGRLSAHMNDLMLFADAPELTTQRCQVTDLGKSIDILRRVEAPNTWLEVSCDPDHALPFAELSYSEFNQTEVIDTRAPNPAPWKFNIKAGIYKLTANFETGGFQNKTHPISAIPPITREKIPCI